MDYALLILTIIIFAVQTICFKEFNRLFMKNLASYFLFNTLYFSLVILIYLAVNRQVEPLSSLTTILALIFGVLFTVTILMLMKAMEKGPLSYSSLIFSLGLLVPVIFGALFWKEGISIPQIFGLLMLLLTLIMGSRPTNRVDEPKAKVNLQWLIIVIASLLGNGMLMTVSKSQQMVIPGQEIEEFLILGFGTSAVLSLILFLYHRIRRGEKVGHMKSWLLFMLVIVAGVTTASGNQIALYLSGRMPAIIQYPSVSGGIVLFSTITAVLFYKERLTRTKVIGLITGLAALVLLSLR